MQNYQTQLIFFFYSPTWTIYLALITIQFTKSANFMFLTSRLRGMPYSATVDDIVGFLGELSLFIIPHGIHFVLNQQVNTIHLFDAKK